MKSLEFFGRRALLAILAIGHLPTATDMWLAIIALILAFGHAVPWFVWAFLAIEVGMTIRTVLQLKKAQE